jgi:flagellar basal-body rod modification protein FlgD
MINLQATPTTIANQEANKFDELGLNSPKKTTEKSDKNQFLELMIAQLENQNPLDPQEGGEFLAQLAQFSMVDGIERLNTSTDSMSMNFRSSQALEAASLVGRTVSVATERFQGGGEVRGAVNVPAATSNVRVLITNLVDEPIKDINLGEKQKGSVGFVWDGTDNAGLPMPPGSYKVSAFSKSNDGEEQLSTEVSMNVDSVTLGEEGSVELNVAGFGVVSLNDVRQIR